jgi:hypothetical protein
MVTARYDSKLKHASRIGILFHIAILLPTTL